MIVDSGRALDHRGLTGQASYDPELQRFTGHVTGLRDQIYFEGRTHAELEESFRRAVDHHLAVCRARGEAPK